MKKVVIIGATGSTGINLTEHLSDNGYKVFATGYKERSTDYYRQRNIKYCSLDIARREDFLKLPQKDVDCVILLAGIMPGRMKGYDPFKYIDINITGTLNTLEYCKNIGISKIIFAQSHSDVAGHWNTGNYIKADEIRSIKLKGDHAVYIISKCAAVDLIEYYHQEYGIQNVVFRLPTIYCYWPDSTMFVNGSKTEMAYLVFIRKAIEGEPIEIWGNPQIEKDIVYVKDFVQIIERAVESKKAQGIYNVGTGIPTTLEQQIKGIVEVFGTPGKQSELIYKPYKPSQTSYLYDISRTQKDLGYVVRYPYIKMLEDMKKEINNPIFQEIL
ncbi:MAG: NAD(P)-dependent oxidoreductase [Pseudomonadota bacterium]